MNIADANPTLVATTAREVTFRNGEQICTLPAGTEVYCTIRRNRLVRIRVPGTLLTQDVTVASLDIP